MIDLPIAEAIAEHINDHEYYEAEVTKSGNVAFYLAPGVYVGYFLMLNDQIQVITFGRACEPDKLELSDPGLWDRIMVLVESAARTYCNS